MKQLIILALLGSLEANTLNGEKIFDAQCASCHVKLISKEETLKHIKQMKAPPMIEVSHQLKSNIKIVEDIDNEIHRAVVVAFIKDYVLNPHLDKSMCNGGALDRFGLMPSQKGKISDEELDTVAQWVYDYYEGKRF